MYNVIISIECQKISLSIIDDGKFVAIVVLQFVVPIFDATGKMLNRASCGNVPGHVSSIYTNVSKEIDIEHDSELS